MGRDREGLRVAFLAYRGNPHSGGQGVYTRHLTRELTALGHQVTVFAGQPYPRLDAGVGFVPVPSLDLYREPDPFRVPWPWEFRDRIDVLEFALMCTGGFPEPLTFSLRARRLLTGRRGDFDLIHDNQCLGRGVAGMLDDGWPVVATLHHPITVDRELDLAHARTVRRRMTLRRWYGFLGMQKRVAAMVPRVITVSSSSAADIVAQMGVDAGRVRVVPVGVDASRFRPRPDVARAVACQVKRSSTRDRPASPSLTRSSGSSRARSRAAANAPGSLGGTRRPVSPLLPTTSGRAPPVVATRGTAQAMASTAGREKPSYREGTTATSASA